SAPRICRENRGSEPGTPLAKGAAMLNSTRFPATARLLLGALAFPMILAGCVGAVDSNEDVSDQSSALSENANDKTAFEFFVNKGLTKTQAAGIVGNLDQESGMDPTIFQYDGGPGRGIAQWSAGGRWDTTPHANVVWYA